MLNNATCPARDLFILGDHGGAGDPIAPLMVYGPRFPFVCLRASITYSSSSQGEVLPFPSPFLSPQCAAPALLLARPSPLSIVATTTTTTTAGTTATITLL
ncbi:hypothetical protein E2C01_050870 [Portunus trituberculatus]|uniref:Uncharacterized protein n=1 Tax=Portunus trituberculatus TaxID=210409 RepID=A0A5B7GK45_PORTR|nr:hypothetical protein [Portunus trituberculatus]